MKIAIIPARGGSKRIPRKNIRLFDGLPIIHYPISACLAAKCFDEVMVSTDDDEIAEIALNAGANVPFRRSAKNSDDQSTTADVLLEVLEKYRAAGKDLEIGCCVYPVAALVTSERLQEGLNILTENPELNGVVPVLRYGYPIQRAVRIVDGSLQMIEPKHLNTRSQDLEETYHDGGQYYWFRTEALIRAHTLLGSAVAPIHLDDLEAQDIDNESDWRLAELKYKLRRTKV